MAARAPLFAACDTPGGCSPHVRKARPGKGPLLAQDGRDGIGWRPSLARRLGEPYGTLLLTLTITSIEVVAISAVVRHGGPNPTLMRDTLLALIMIIMNGMVTIPSVLVINHLIERPVVLGVEHTDLALLILTLALSMITFTSGRTNMLQGVVHLLLFAAYILLIFQA
jgi:Ca2+:H+ antiporter